MSGGPESRVLSLDWLTSDVWRVASCWAAVAVIGREDSRLVVVLFRRFFVIP